MTSPFAERKQFNVEEMKKAEAAAELHISTLMNSEAGVWFFRQILDMGEVFKNPGNFNNRDYFAMGKRAVALRVMALMKRHGDPARFAEIISECTFE